MQQQQHKLSPSSQNENRSAGKKGIHLPDHRGLNNPVQRKTNNTGLPDNLKSGIENLSGHSMDDVKVHYNSPAPAQLSAHAYAQGTNIHLAPGQEKHLPHEAWHVVQQKQGRVKPTTQLKSKVNVNDDASLEKEADVMGAKAVQLSSRGEVKQLHSVPSGNVQRYVRRSVPGKVVQGYFEVGRGVYTKGTGTDTPNFEFQKTEAVRTENNATSEATYEARTMQLFADSPTLKVSDNRDMAVPAAGGAEAKRFFATTAVINASNHALNLANAPLRLTPGSGKIHLPTLMNPQGITLTQVSPDLSQVAITGHECGVFATNILGVNVNRIHLTTGNTVLRTARAHRQIDLNAALNGNQPETVGANANADPNVGEAFGILGRTPPPPPVLNTFWKGVSAVRNMFTKKVSNLQWGEHWAGVVAKSGGDYVTLENYNRQAAGVGIVMDRLEKDYKDIVHNNNIMAYVNGTNKYRSLPNEGAIARIQRLGREYMKFGVLLDGVTGHYEQDLNGMWYFAMYGQAHQSFHEKWKGSVPNAVTATVH